MTTAFYHALQDLHARPQGLLVRSRGPASSPRNVEPRVRVRVHLRNVLIRDELDASKGDGAAGPKSNLIPIFGVRELDGHRPINPMAFWPNRCWLRGKQLPLPAGPASSKASYLRTK